MTDFSAAPRRAVPDGLVEHLVLTSAVRPGVVAGVQRRLAAHLLSPPDPLVAASVVDSLVDERRRP